MRETRARIEAEGIELVLPVTDAAMRALIDPHVALGSARLAAAAPQAYTSLSDKHELAQLARAAGLETPRGGRVADAQAALALAREIGFPVVVKPIVSVVRDASGRLRKPEVMRVESAEALPDAFERAAAGGEALLQRCVEGWGEGLCVLRWEGRTLAAFAHRRLREKPPGGGVSVLAESIAVDAERLARVESLLDRSGYSGLAMAEFKSDGRRAWLIEVNARAVGLAPARDRCGRGLPESARRRVRGRPARSGAPVPHGCTSALGARGPRPRAGGCARSGRARRARRRAGGARRPAAPGGPSLPLGDPAARRSAALRTGARGLARGAPRLRLPRLYGRRQPGVSSPGSSADSGRGERAREARFGRVESSRCS